MSAASKMTEAPQRPQRKRVRPKVDLEAPGPQNFDDVCMSEFPFTEDEALFWYESIIATYVPLYNEISIPQDVLDRFSNV